MATEQLVALILQGGAVVVLFLWVRDLQEQRKTERDERIANAEVIRTVGVALGELTAAINALVDEEPPRPPRERH